jgi:hypothetical protein
MSVWDAVQSLLSEKGELILSVYSEEELLHLVQSRMLDLWVGMKHGKIDGIAFCGWELHSHARYYHILHALGYRAQEFLPVGLPVIEHWACSFGATEVVIEGRKGWQRLLQKFGYLTPTVRLRKNVRKAWSN